MNIRRFEALSINDALEMVRAEFGEDAVIMHTNRRRRRDEATGVIQNIVEVVAAIDHTSQKETVRCQKEEERETAAALRGGGFIHSSPLLVIQDVLTWLGIEPRLQNGLAVRFMQGISPDGEITRDLVFKWIHALVSQNIRVGDRAEGIGPGLRLAMIGPTGVGKTTTIAKLAAKLKLKNGMDGVVVSADTYRLGAAEQLSRYARLMDIRFEAVRDQQELQRLFERYKSTDFILVDTTGRNLRDPRHEEELSALFSSQPALLGYAVLCATSKTEDIMAQIKFYSKFRLAGWIISKIDETASYGPLYAPIIWNQLPISYITNGQKVPEDMKEATKKELMALLLPSGGSSGSDHIHGKNNRPVMDIKSGGALY
ncbi:MAG: hypothetical protein M0022_02450 [Desulfobacteraceae bacterium]|nr:hypothetical protein [Desulfobacteraceae bacterium]